MEPMSALRKLVERYVWGAELEGRGMERKGVEAFGRHNEAVLRAAGESGRELLVREVGEGVPMEGEGEGIGRFRVMIELLLGGRRVRLSRCVSLAREWKIGELCSNLQ
jgi:hypothetical protein